MMTRSTPLPEHQLAVVLRPMWANVFLNGQAGAGKTIIAVSRLLHLLDAGIPADSILAIVPQRTLARPYYEALRSPELAAGGGVTVLTVRGPARRLVTVLWPSIPQEAGFVHPEHRPVFLTLEAAQ